MELSDRFYSVAVVPIPGEGYANVYGRDITERKRAEEALRETRDYLENLFNYANAPVICWDGGQKITRFNHAFENMTGYRADEVIGKGLSMLFPSPRTPTKGRSQTRKLCVWEPNFLPPPPLAPPLIG